MYRGPAANRWLTPSARRPEAITTFVDHAVARLGPVDGGHDLLSHLNDPAALAASLTTQALKGLPLAHALLSDQASPDPPGIGWSVGEPLVERDRVRPGDGRQGGPTTPSG